MWHLYIYLLIIPICEDPNYTNLTWRREKISLTIGKVRHMVVQLPQYSQKFENGNWNFKWGWKDVFLIKSQSYVLLRMTESRWLSWVWHRANMTKIRNVYKHFYGRFNIQTALARLKHWAEDILNLSPGHKLWRCEVYQN